MKVAQLTGTGTAAIATIAAWGEGVWKVVCEHFHPAGKPLPEEPTEGLTRFGKLGTDLRDEVILVVTHVEPPGVEFHCHGGRQVVRELMQVFWQAGCDRVAGEEWLEELGYGGRPAANGGLTKMLPHALTARTAGMIVDRMNGKDDPLWPKVAEHLTKPWIVAIAGKPNVGKSSLLNALAGYQRSVVAPIPGTTRDVVSALTAFDGWPVELRDTAGIRETWDEIEKAGVERAKGALAESDLVVWVTDNDEAEPGPEFPTHSLKVRNKIDLIPSTRGDRLPVSAATGEGLETLIATIVDGLLNPGKAPPHFPMDRG